VPSQGYSGMTSIIIIIIISIIIIITSCTLCDTQSLIFADFSATSFASVSRSSRYKHKPSHTVNILCLHSTPSTMLESRI